MDAGVGALEVVAVEVLDQVTLEGGDLGDQGAGEAGPPALLEDGPLDSLDAAVRLGPAGMDEAVMGTGGRHGPAEAELRALVMETACSRRPAAASLAATQRTSAGVSRAAGLRV